MAFTITLSDQKQMEELKHMQIYDALQYCKPKEQVVLMRKFGLVTKKETPLQRIGKDYSLTRERVRQVESQALMRFRRLIVGNAKYLVVIDEAKSILAAAGGLMDEAQLVQTIFDSGKFPFSFQELRVILVSDFDISYVRRNKLIDKCFYLDGIFEDFLTQLATQVLSHFSHTGKSMGLYDCVALMKKTAVQQQPSVKYFREDQFYINFFSVIRTIVMFDGRIGLDSFDDVAPKTIRLKLLYTMRKHGEPVHYNELPDMVMQHFFQKPVKITTIHNELVKNNSVFVNLGMGTYGLTEWGHKGGTVVEILFRIFKKAGRPLMVKEIAKEVLKEKMASPNTILLNLQKYKQLFQRVDKGVYTLHADAEHLDETQVRSYITE